MYIKSVGGNAGKSWDFSHSGKPQKACDEKGQGTVSTGGPKVSFVVCL